METNNLLKLIPLIALAAVFSCVFLLPKSALAGTSPDWSIGFEWNNTQIIDGSQQVFSLNLLGLSQYTWPGGPAYGDVFRGEIHNNAQIINGHALGSAGNSSQIDIWPSYDHYFAVIYDTSGIIYTSRIQEIRNWFQTGVGSPPAHWGIITFEITPQQLLPLPSDLNQFGSDESTPIGEGQMTTKNAVVFKAKVGGPNNDRVGLEVELRQFNEPLTGQYGGGIVSSDSVLSGSVVAIVRYGLAEGQYHWRARTVDSQGNKSDWLEFGTPGNVDFEVVSLGQGAADLAKIVINAPYLGNGNSFGGKGWDPLQKMYVASDEIFTGYNYWNNKLRQVAFGAGLDCSGLVEWAFDRSFDPLRSLLHNAIRYESADGQYHHNSEAIAEANLRPGDLLFLDKNHDNRMDHVAMYVGNFVVNNNTFNMVEAYSPQQGIIPANESEFRIRTGFSIDQNIRRVVLSPAIGGFVRAGSPIDLAVTDPDGFTITATTLIQTDEEFLREVPGQLYYVERELGPDGFPDDVVYWPTQKTGDYLIKAAPKFGAPLMATYSLTFQSGDQTVTLAKDVPITQIPPDGYGVTVPTTGTTESFIPVSIDIKPGSDPNSINIGSKGVVPVAVLSNSPFNAKDVDIDSILFAGAKPAKNSYEDVNGDGNPDLILHFDTQSLNLTTNDTKAFLTGNLTSGLLIKGSDFVKIIANKKHF